MSRAVRPRVITDEEFLRAWKACESTTQVAARLGMTISGVGMRVKAMRARGVDVPKQEVSP